LIVRLGNDPLSAENIDKVFVDIDIGSNGLSEIER
jgi:hypothetical protein